MTKQVTSSLPTPEGTGGQAGLPKNISTARKRIFFIIAISIPIFFFLILELSLRVFDYGTDLSLFKIDTAGGKLYYVMNPAVKNRYFSRFDFNPTTSQEHFLVSKPAGTFRIFCLGGSTTVGYPYWYNGAFSSFLRDRLESIFPDHTVEIINLGMTATNSYTVLDFSNDLMKYEPDLLIVYDGHNEFYGALGAASNENAAPSRWMTLLYLRVIHLRTFQLLNNCISGVTSIFGRTQIDYSKRATMMEQVARGKKVPYGSKTYNQCYSIFQQNLKALTELCRERNIPLIISTQASNLRDQYPFISGNSPGISLQQKTNFNLLYRRGLELKSGNELDSAVVCFKSAIRLDSLYADTHYQLAQCLDAEGKKQEAYREYVRARDYDELRFRTDTRFNNLINSMKDGKNCIVADIEKVFKSYSQDSLTGHNLIIEHLHPSSYGHFLMAKEYASLMHQYGLLASATEWAKNDTITDENLWNERHLTALDEIIAAQRTEALTSGWPFKNKVNTLSQIRVSDTLKFIAEQAIHDKMSWGSAHERAAEFYLRRSDSTSAEMEYKTIINQLPFDVAAYLRLAHLYFDQKKFPNSESILLASINIKPTPIAYRVLGDISMRQSKAADAIRYYEQLSNFPDDPVTAPENAYMLSLAYLIEGNDEEAIRILQRTINLYPEYIPARQLLQKVRIYEKNNPRK